MKIGKGVVLVCIQIILLCLVFFVIGYGKAYQHAVNYANDFIDDNCMRKIGYEDYIRDAEQALLNFNFTIIGGNENG